jgi:hypothetical protein
MCFPLISPIGLPTPVGIRTEQYHEQIEILPPGGVVILAQQAAPTIYPEVEGAILATLKHIAAKSAELKASDGEGLKLLIWSSYHPSCLPVADSIYKPLLESQGLVMYEDFVIFAFVPGGSSALTRLAYGMKEVVGTDFYNVDLTTIAMMDDIDVAADVNLYTAYGAYYYDTGTDWIVKFRIPCIVASAGWAAPGMEAAFARGAIQCYVTSLRGGAEYENYADFPGPASAMIESLVFIHVYVFILLTISNIIFFYKKGGF